MSAIKLNPEDYTIKNALSWGNFRAHLTKAGKGSFGKRIIHLVIAAAEFLPIIGQISSLFEYFAAKTSAQGKREKASSLIGRVSANPPLKIDKDALQKNVFKTRQSVSMTVKSNCLIWQRRAPLLLQKIKKI